MMTEYILIENIGAETDKFDQVVIWLMQQERDSQLKKKNIFPQTPVRQQARQLLLSFLFSTNILAITRHSCKQASKDTTI